MHSLSALIAEIVAFVVVVVVLARYAWPLVRTMAEERQDTVTRQVNEAADAELRLATAHRRFDEALAEARAEAARIRDDARNDAHHLREELREQAEQEVARIRQRGQEQLAAQRDQVVRRLRAEIGALALEQARRRVVDRLADEGARSASVDTFLDELDDVAARSREPAASTAASTAVSAVSGGTN